MDSDASGQLERVQDKLASSEVKEALVLCGQLLSGRPMDPDVCVVCGTALLRVGHACEALAVIAPAAELHPKRDDLKRLRVACLLAGGQLDLAYQMASEGLQANPGDAEWIASSREARVRIVQHQALVQSVGRPLVDTQQRAALREDFRQNYHLVPIVINSRDRRSHLEALLTWLRSAGYLNVAILDNCSTYPPLLELLRRVESEVLVYRLPNNLGSRSLWLSGLISLVEDVPFVYTDPDVLPVGACPGDAVRVLYDLLDEHAFATKAGLGIRIDDLPDTYEHKAAVQAWEGQFWRYPLHGNCYCAPVDTTFALYRPGAWHNLRAVRSSFPYLVRHLPWYMDSAHRSAEDQYYAENALPVMSSWSGNSISALYQVPPKAPAGAAC